MKAVRFHETGGPDVLVYEAVPDPTPRPGEVLEQQIFHVPQRQREAHVHQQNQPEHLG